MKKIYSIIALAVAFCAFLPLAKAQGIVSKGKWIEKDGLSYTKYISEPNTDGIYMITLESFTTGSIELTDKSVPADIVLVLDVSGSMGNRIGGSGTPTRLNAMKDAVRTFIDTINENDLYIPGTNPKQTRPTRLGNRIAIITFANSGGSQVRAQLTPLTDGGSSLKTIVNGLSSGGNTYVGEGMQKALGELSSERIDDSRKLRTVVLFTDGAPGSGDNWESSSASSRNNSWNNANSTINYANQIKEMADESKEIKSTVYTVTVQNSPSIYTKVFLGKTSSNWKGATTMGAAADWASWDKDNPWSNGNGTQVAGPDPEDKGPDNYAFATTDATELNEIFAKMAESSGGSSAPLSGASVAQVDVVSASFALPEGAQKEDIEVYTVRYIGDSDDGTHNFKTKTVGGKVVDDLVKAPTSEDKYMKKWLDTDGVEHEELTDIDNAITWDLTPSQTGGTKKDKITVTGFDYANLWCGPDPTSGSEDYPGWHQGYKIVIKIPVRMDEEAVGGPTLATNGPNSGIYVNGQNQFPFESPVVSLPVNIHIRKEGLAVGESAKFRIERSTDKSTWTRVTSVFVTRTENDAEEGENAPITKIYGLPATDDSTPAQEYIYRVVEEPWTWSYVTGTKTPTSTDLLEVNPFIFTNQKKDNIDNKVKNGESKSFNTFLPGNTEGSYVDSKPRTTTSGTTTP